MKNQKKIKAIRMVYSPSVEKLLKTHLNKVCYKGYSSNVRYIKVMVLGITIKRLGITKDIRDSYNYELYLYGSQEDLNYDTNRAGLKAKNLIKKYVSEPEEPYVEDIKRPVDFLISDYFMEKTIYKGHWVDIDMNSAEPYFVTKVLPELEKPIRQKYAKRHSHPENKLILNAINGNLRNMYPSKYLAVVNMLFARMGVVWEELENYGIIPFALRRDGILARVPYKNCPLPPSIKIGSNMGEFKAIYDYGSIMTTKSEYTYITDMKKIGSKIQGKPKPRYLDRLSIVCLGRYGLVITKRKRGTKNGTTKKTNTK